MDCHLSAEGMADRIPAQCGTLTVAENPAEPEGRTIDLRVAVLEAISRDAAPDPLFLLAGGPGQAATEAFLPLLRSLREIRQDRDLVLVDQRGTGSSNPLDCAEQDDLESLNTPSEEEIRENLEECLAQLDADPRFYTTSLAMDDLDAVRAALGYEKINLYGVSYGTRTAQTYLAKYPERVRSVILDGVAPQSLALGLTWARDAQRSLDLLFSRCAADSACAEAFPDPKRDLDELLSFLEDSPREADLLHPVSGEPVEIEVPRDLVAGIVQRLSYTPETAALLPLLIHGASIRKDLSVLAAQGVLAIQVGGGMSIGMTLSVLCAEDVHLIDEAEAEKLYTGTYFGDLQVRSLRQSCAAWPRGEIPAGFKDPVRSDVPVLLLSGETDPVTPPNYGEEVAAGLTNSLHLIAPGAAHNVLPRGCMTRIAEGFIETGSVEGLDVECVEDIAPVPFFLTASGPAP